ncbi:hypothetical protein [Burkholderia sp. Bp9090]|uniref:hypothetical protein n=1 Tax=Burkholderia sp. Bp9090 TaxID=2184567 RepID=UPI000F5E4F9B|nr:hypothetical protein [Burkholderia sp. Bp9090]
MAPILPEWRRETAPVKMRGHMCGFRPLLRDVLNKKSARRGTDTKNGSRREVDAAGNDLRRSFYSSILID